MDVDKLWLAIKFNLNTRVVLEFECDSCSNIRRDWETKVVLFRRLIILIIWKIYHRIIKHSTNIESPTQQYMCDFNCIQLRLY